MASSKADSGPKKVDMQQYKELQEQQAARA